VTTSHPHQPHHEAHLTPWQRLGQLFIEDRTDLIALLMYTAVNGLLLLTVPLAAQALVNTIAAGMFLQPLTVLSLLLLMGLLFAGVLRIAQITLAEMIQQRILGRMTLRLAYRIPRLSTEAMAGESPAELVNRFFDVLNIQKSWSKLLLDGPSAALQILVGLVLLGFYHPTLVVFDVLLLLAIAFVLFVLGWGGLRTSIQESVQKYRIADYLQNLARNHWTHKLSGWPTSLLTTAGQLVDGYIGARQKHFSVLWRQALGAALLYALASYGILALGGWLVIQRELTLGQLVAAELIVVSILSNFEKLTRLIDPMFDLLTGLDKVGHLTDVPLEDGSEGHAA
jgi:ABC-type bacteriocin/lantibiotic exporter with double-glycine peptidase domain